MPITYERRRANAVAKAVEQVKPYIRKYLMNSESGHIDQSVNGPVVQAVRRYFLGYKQGKNDAVKTIKITRAEIDKVIWTALREEMQAPGMIQHLSKKNKAMKTEKAKEVFNPWSAKDETKPVVRRKVKPLETKHSQWREKLIEQMITLRHEDKLATKK